MRKRTWAIHWKDHKLPPSAPLLRVEPDPAAPNRHASGLIGVLQQVRASLPIVGWKKTALLYPESYSGTYRLGFTAMEGNKKITQLCTLDLNGAVAVLVGPYETEYFGVDDYGVYHQLRFRRNGDRSEKSDIPLI